MEKKKNKKRKNQNVHIRGTEKSIKKESAFRVPEHAGPGRAGPVR
jgi:hypothetical protein